MKGSKKILAAFCTVCWLLAGTAEAKKLSIIYVPLDSRPECRA